MLGIHRHNQKTDQLFAAGAFMKFCKAPSAMGFEPMTPGRNRVITNQAAWFAVGAFWEDGVDSRPFCRSSALVTIFRFGGRLPSHPAFTVGCLGEAACRVSIAYRCIIHLLQRKIVEKKLRTQIFRSEFADFSVFSAAAAVFLQNPPGKPPSQRGRRTAPG